MADAAAGTPLCPAGHLPHKGGDRVVAYVSPNNTRLIRRKFVRERAAGVLLISPLVGEMSGRTEGGTSRSISRKPR